MAVKIVAVAGHANDWAAYRGYSDWPDELVASNGDKIEQEQAEAVFWAMANSGRSYRR
jgi:hypothetical protein